MQTRKDLYQAHKLMTQRVALALLQGQPDAVESPMRRMVVASLCGAMVAVVVAATYGIIGLIFKGGARGLEKPGMLIIERETGAKYGYSASSRALIPFLNYTSARLAMPSGQIERRTVSRKSLAKYDRGPLSGIPGAPDALPDAGRLARAPWSLCVRRTDAGATLVSLVGGRDVGGRALSLDQGVLVRDETQAWLIWANKRLRVSPASQRVLSNAEPVPVAGRWLNGLPQGPDFAAPDLPGRGRPGAGPSGGQVPVGVVYRAALPGGERRWYVQLLDGLAGISETQAELLLSVAGAPAEREITLAAANGKPSAVKVFDGAIPERRPRIVPYDPAQPLCATYRDTDRLSLDARLTIGGSLPAGSTVSSGGVDQVVMPGGGTLAGLLPGPNIKPQTYFLVTAQGVRFPVPAPEDVAKLGYSASSAVPVPAGLLRLLREGPTLSSAAALKPLG